MITGYIFWLLLLIIILVHRLTTYANISIYSLLGFIYSPAGLDVCKEKWTCLRNTVVTTVPKWGNKFFNKHITLVSFLLLTSTNAFKVAWVICKIYIHTAEVLNVLYLILSNINCAKMNSRGITNFVVFTLHRIFMLFLLWTAFIRNNYVFYDRENKLKDFMKITK